MSGQAIGLTTALITGCTAIVVGLITGWFARSAGVRQADATRESGARQADALLATVRSTLEEQRSARVLDLRRETYARLIEAAENVIQARMRGEDRADDRTTLRRAFSVVVLEGPDDVVPVARELVDCLGGEGFPSIEDIERAKQDFIDSARSAIARVGRSGSGPHSG